MSAVVGKQVLSDYLVKTIYTVPPGKVATVSLNLCNFTDHPRKVYVLIYPTSQASGTANDWYEKGTIIPAEGILERTGLVMSAGEMIVAWDDGAGIAARIHGFAEDM